MVQERFQRRLLAIIFSSDVVGYSRMMESDEAGTFKRLKAYRRELGEPLIKVHNGRIVKLTGDGALVEVASAVEAVSCAVKIQRSALNRNAGALEDQRIVFRIGINLGDIIVDPDGDIYGDCVNVAARLEAFAPTGGIAISRAVCEQVRDHLPYAFEDRGEHQVRGLVRPVHVFVLGPNAIAGLSIIEPSLSPIRQPKPGCPGG